jgi:hypothetical protein
MPADATTNEIEQAFLDSWGKVEQFYGVSVVSSFLATYDQVGVDKSDMALFNKWLARFTTEDNWRKSILDLMAELRRRGYDKQLRAGTSLYTLVLSRSHQHGLRPDQPWIYFGPTGDGGTNVAYLKGAAYGPPQIVLAHVELTSEVQNLLDKLLAHPID